MTILSKNLAIQTRAAAGFVFAILLVAPLWLSSATTALAQMSVPHSDFVVAQPVVNMYSKPSDQSDVVSQVLYGTGVASIEKQPGWIHIQTADGYKGWVAGADVKTLEAGPYAPEGRSVRIAGMDVNVYREPDVTRHAPLLKLPWEARLEVVADAPNNTERWLQVKLVDGQTAWVQRGDISAAFSPLTIDRSLALARKFIGVTYTWGGVSSRGFDCSGFTQMVERQRGIEMPRDADLQAAWSGVVPVDRKDLKPGDLLFFGSGVDKITHTGMYLGNGEFIHDTTHDHPGVQISRLDDMPWTKLLVAQRRIK